jgi:very-short-patch-repair endonuclease
MFAVALDRGLTRRVELRRLMDRHKRAPGSGKLRWLVAANPSLARSEAEDRLQGLVRSAGLPEPRTNVKIEGLEVDCYWPAQGLVVEVDGFAYHGSRAAFERDRSRDRRLTAAGMSVIRVTWRQLDQEPLAVVAQLAQALAAPSRR